MKKATYVRAARLYHQLSNLNTIIYSVKRDSGNFAWIEFASGTQRSTKVLPGYLSESILPILEAEAASIREKLEELKDE